MPSSLPFLGGSNVGNGNFPQILVVIIQYISLNLAIWGRARFLGAKPQKLMDLLEDGSEIKPSAVFTSSLLVLKYLSRVRRFWKQRLAIIKDWKNTPKTTQYWHRWTWQSTQALPSGMFYVHYILWNDYPANRLFPYEILRFVWNCAYSTNALLHPMPL